MNEMVKAIKEIHKKDICMFKIGTFYHCYGRDANIIAYVFDYQIQSNKNNKECGFPVGGINKVIAKLESLKINYLLLDRRNNYEVDAQIDFKELNTYEEFYQKSNVNINYKTRINNINEFLLENMEEEDFCYCQ